MIETIYSKENNQYLLMDRVYEDNQTRTLATEYGLISVAPTKNENKLGIITKSYTNIVMKLNTIFIIKMFLEKVFTRYDWICMASYFLRTLCRAALILATIV